MTNDGSRCGAMEESISMFTSSAVKWKGGDMSEYLFRTYQLIAQGRKFGPRSPSCGLRALIFL